MRKPLTARWLTVAAFLILPAIPATADRPAANSTGIVQVDFARDVQPIFAERCFKCHGPKKQESGFRLDVAHLLLEGGDSDPLIPPRLDACDDVIRCVALARFGLAWCHRRAVLRL